ncbi:methyl-accepting chemotaxis protein [Thorsellia kenyensis]|uniref:Methyl-accepting chemotaxis protein n=1 Tax=Thorsellia kenyensis TaxID=1549888 RepID=A0ABV6CCT5_9GAMM
MKSGLIKVRTKILLGFSVIIAMIFVVVFTSIFRVNSIADSLEYVDKFNSVKQRHAINFRGSVHDRAIAARDVILVETSSDVPAVVENINKLKADYDKSYDALYKLINENIEEITPEEMAILNKIQSIREKTLPLIDEIIENRLNKNYVRAELVMMEKARPLFIEWLNTINQFIDLQEQSSAIETQKALSNATEFQAFMLVLLVIATVVGLISAILVVRSISRSLGDEPSHVSAIADEIASGNLAINIPTSDADSNSVIVAIAGMRDGLTEMIAKVRESTEHIEVASEKIEGSNVSLSTRTDQQASSLNQIAESMSHLTTTVQNNTKNARLATEKSNSASSVAVKGGEVISEMVSTMASINESSRKVSDITSVIDSIAFQTNILALNAAVEAARAGEHGRGFAVVATEVRNLAQRSATAAREIASLINDSVQRVDTGNLLANQAGKSINDIVNSVHEVTDIISQITASSEEQSAGIQQVGGLIQQMEQITHMNLSMVREANEASLTLKSQVIGLGKLIAAFKMFDSAEYNKQHDFYAKLENNELTSSHLIESNSKEPTIDLKKAVSDVKPSKYHDKNQVDGVSDSRSKVDHKMKTSTEERNKIDPNIQKKSDDSNHKSESVKIASSDTKAKQEELKRPKVYNLGGQEVKSPTGAPTKKKVDLASDHDDWEEF